MKFSGGSVDNSKAWAQCGRTGDIGLGVSFEEYHLGNRPSKLRVPGSSPGGITTLSTLITLMKAILGFVFRESLKVYSEISLPRQKHRRWANCAHDQKTGTGTQEVILDDCLTSSLPRPYRQINSELKFSTLDGNGGSRGLNDDHH